ncbi:CD48 antigen [Sturnira hondurensis]|uniref:CD48 antigen n=1 Tax=Sturnira hondurensis TaxID=192404 RepID=UPI0018791C8B|nr:CD48 antigen [Sturnira hondurensis]
MKNTEALRLFQSGSCLPSEFLGSSVMCSKGLKLCLALELLLLPLCFLETSVQGYSEPLESAVSGSNVILPINNLPYNHLSLTLFYNSNQKILEWESYKPNPHFFKTTFEDRIILDRKNGILYIYKVHKKDTGTYHLKVAMENGTEKEWKFPLKVLDPVPKPVIKIEKTQEVNNSCFLILSCVIPDNTSVQYFWYSDSDPLPKELQSEVLNISIKPQDYSKFYTCQVTNSVSSNNETVNFTSACTPARSSGVAWISAWLVVMIPTILGLLLTFNKLSQS